MYVQPSDSNARPAQELGAAPAAAAGSLPEVKSCDPKTWGDVFAHWRMAVDAVNKINDRLRMMAFMTNRIGFWTSGPERVWFGNFQLDHFDQLKRNMQQIQDILRDPQLTIVCDESFDKYGKAFPGIRRIKLGSGWKLETRQHEKTQTLIHESAHIAGVLNGLTEARKYGPACAKKLAQQNCFKAMRNADNYGYYALHFIGEYQSASPSACPSNYPTRAC